jgi:hypothetical protein
MLSQVIHNNDYITIVNNYISYSFYIQPNEYNFRLKNKIC